MITTYQSGLSVTPTSPDQSGVTFIAQRANASGADPGSAFTLNGAPIVPGADFGTSNRGLYWFNPNVFSETGPLQLGTAGRNVLGAPGFWNSDLSAFKQFQIKEGISLELRGEFFDILNQTRFDPPNTDASSVAFGQLVSAEQPRIIQVALRLQF